MGKLNLTEDEIRTNAREILAVNPGEMCTQDLKTLINLFSNLYQIDLVTISRAALCVKAEDVMRDAKLKGYSSEEQMAMASSITGMNEGSLQFWLD